MPQDTPYKPSGWAIFDQVLGGRTITDARDTLIAREQARRAREQEMDALAAFGETVRGMMGGTPGGAGAPDPVSAEMGMLSGSMQNAPGPKTYSAPIGPGMDGEPLPAVRQEAPRPPPQQAQRQPASLPAGPPRLPTYRDFAPVLAEAVMSGNPTVAARASALAGVFDKAGPSIKYERGMRYDERDPSSAPGYIPDLAEGQEPLFDSNGRIVAVRNMDGSVKAAADMAGAVTGAQELAKAGLDLIYTEADDGSAVQETRAQAVDRVTGGAGGLPALPGGGGPRAPAAGPSGTAPRLGVRQSPAQQRLETDRAATQASVEALSPKAMSTLQTLDRKTDFVIEKMIEARNAVRGGLGGNAGLNAWAASVPNTAAYNLRTVLDTIEAAVGFDELAQMRENSPTGGAVGNLTERELALLSSLRGSFKQGMSPDQLQTNLDRAIVELETIRKERQEAFQRQYGAPAAGSPGATARRPTPEEARAELKRRGLIQ